MLRQRLQETQVDLMGYCLTDNHVHLLLAVPDKEQMAHLMQRVAGDFAQTYNRRSVLG